MFVGTGILLKSILLQIYSITIIDKYVDGII